MPRKRANKRKSTAPVRREFRLPTVSINWGLLGNAGLLLGVIAGVYFGTLWLLDQQINSVRIEGRFERVSSLQVEAAITPFMNQGFLGADLRTVQHASLELPGVQAASVRRSWPATGCVSVTDERAAARGGLTTRWPRGTRGLGREEWLCGATAASRDGTSWPWWSSC